MRRYINCVLVLAMLAVCGCDPVVTVAGADFPDWLVCALVGSVLAAACHPPLQVSGMERHLRPLPFFYGSLIVMFSALIWIVFFSAA
ncbi:MAG: YtcA family lipoprotein [Candidatus Binataceae bacterium]